MKLLGVVLATLLALVLWCVGVFLAWDRGHVMDPVAPPGDVDTFLAWADATVAEADPGNLALLLVEDGGVAGERYVSRAAPVGRDTRFQVASLSKWLTAIGVMRLVETGDLDLDAPVSTWLTRWSLPESPHPADAVTLRRLLSHTAGLVDGLGFAGYAPDAPLPDLVGALEAPNASTGAPVRIVQGQPPGGFAYSGGGYLIAQLVIEEVTGERFEDWMAVHVLGPLGMTDSSFDPPPPDADVAPSWNVDGTEAPLYRFVATGAAGLFTTPADLARLVDAHLDPPPPGPLTTANLRTMRRPEAYALRAPIWGLGTILHAPVGDDFVFGHAGRNDPAINTEVRIDPTDDDAIIVLESGAPILATRIASAWTLWTAGRPDFFTMTSGPVMRSMAMAMVIGGALIVALGFFAGWRVRRT
jgi:CubicO group peptidase (beta-lactamase class C family)